jgi:hypothetical protein
MRHQALLRRPDSQKGEWQSISAIRANSCLTHSICSGGNIHLKPILVTNPRPWSTLNPHGNFLGSVSSSHQWVGFRTNCAIPQRSLHGHSKSHSAAAFRRRSMMATPRPVSGTGSARINSTPDSSNRRSFAKECRRGFAQIPAGAEGFAHSEPVCGSSRKPGSRPGLRSAAGARVREVEWRPGRVVALELPRRVRRGARPTCSSEREQTPRALHE